MKITDPQEVLATPLHLASYIFVSYNFYLIILSLTCKSLLRMTDQKCPRDECLPNPYNISKYFDIPVDITDHTGTLNNCRLVSQAAENTLNCNVDTFLKMGDVQKGKLKWRYLLERCALKLIIKRKSPIRFQSVYTIVECSVAKPQEVELKIKVY